MIQQIKIDKYFPFVFIYFFVNAVALPFGLTYTSLLAPFFYVWILITRRKEILLPFISILAPFILIHILFVGVDIPVYMISLLNLILIYISVQAAYTFFKVCQDPEKIFRWLLIINFFLCLVSILFYFSPYAEIFWIQQDYTRGVNDFLRLKMFTYEASYYATLFTPVFFFFFLQYLFNLNKIRSGWLLLMIFLPYVLSLSIGVIGSIAAAGFIVWLIYFKPLTQKRRIINLIVSAGAVIGATLTFIVIFFRHNPIFTRIGNIFSGNDLSTNGRTQDAYLIAGKLLEQKDKYWGIGIGQIKIAGADIIREYYFYPPWHEVSLPSAVAETWTMYGWIGLFLRFGIEIFLFFYTKVWSNYYRLMLFFFIFIFQFAGSFTTNIAEYVIWVLAFTNVFKQFDVVFEKRGSFRLSTQRF